jgi:hypothetical protein
MSNCRECGAIYDAPWKAAYCARQDVDPRKENQRLRDGAQLAIVAPNSLEEVTDAQVDES